MRLFTAVLIFHVPDEITRLVVEQLQNLISENKLEDKVELGGTFCLGECQKGVCVTVDSEFFSVSPESVNDFFAENVIAKVK